MVAERRDTFSAALAGALGIPPSVARVVVDAVGPTSADVRRPNAFDVPAAVRRMSAWFTANCTDIEPVQADGMSGFVAVGGYPGDRAGIDARLAILVSPDGRRIAHERPQPGRELVMTSWTGDDSVGRVLQRAGLLTGVDGGEVDDLVHRTLSRLDPDALRLLRCAPAFSPMAFAVAADLNRDCAFVHMVEELPLLGVEIHNASPSATFGYDLCERITLQLSTSDEPVSEYLSDVRDFVRNEWPGLVLDDTAAETALRKVCKIEALQDHGIQPCHVAFLSFGPPDRLPTSAAQLRSMMEFVENVNELFGEGVGMRPSDFYGSFDGDWIAAEKLRRRYFDDLMSPHTVLFDVCVELVEALLESKDMNVSSDEVGNGPAVDIVFDLLIPRLVNGRGLRLLTALGTWSTTRSGKGDEKPSKAAVFQALTTSGLLPHDLRGLTPEEVLRKLGINPERLVGVFKNGRRPSPATGVGGSQSD